MSAVGSESDCEGRTLARHEKGVRDYRERESLGGYECDVQRKFNKGEVNASYVVRRHLKTMESGQGVKQIWFTSSMTRRRD